MKKFDRSEARRFWEVRDAEWAKLDHADDPEALQNIIYAGQPLWFSRRWAGYMGMAYEALFDLVPEPGPEARALDIGCGAGRWSAFLKEHGYRTVGIDIQKNMIEENRLRYPDIEFHYKSIQDYSPDGKFDLVSSSTVIQHNPPDEQLMVVGKIRRLLEDGGHVIVLESIRDTPDPFTFPRKVEGWTKLFEDAGFETVEVRRYHYNLFSRLGARVLSTARGTGASDRLSAEGSTLEEMASIPERRRDPRLLYLARRAAVGLDGRVEPVLSGLNAPLSSYHCGFLFRAV